MKILITIGFMFEILFFIAAGVSLTFVPGLSFIFVILGIVLAFFVGKAMEKDVLERYGWEEE